MLVFECFDFRFQSSLFRAIAECLDFVIRNAPGQLIKFLSPNKLFFQSRFGDATVPVYDQFNEFLVPRRV